MGNLCASPNGIIEDNSVPTKLEDAYTLHEELGSGAYSTVYAATNNKTKQRVAVKIIDRKNVSAADEKSLLREVNIMKTLQHPNIVQLYDFYSESTRLCLVLELLDGGELFDRIVKRKAYNESVARDAIRNVFTGLKYMHDLDVAHRDLKPENLLLAHKDDDSNIKIADFGFARCDASAMVTQCGTPNYVAPEVLTGGSTAYTKAVDMWSMGIILFIILGGYPPFQHKNQAKLFHKIKKGSFEFHEKYWSHISPEAKDLIRKLLELNTKKRLTVTQALEHPWATAAVIVDGDASWFSNPQYKLRCDVNVVVNISLTPVNIGPDDSYDLDNTTNGNGNGLPLSSSSQVPNVNIYVVQPHPSLTQLHPCVGDALSTLLVAQSPKVEKGHEASLWSLRLQRDTDYYIIPSTSKKGQRWGYVLRIFASEPIQLEKIPRWHVTTLTGEWAKTSTTDTTGGPPRLITSSDDLKATGQVNPLSGGGGGGGGSHKAHENSKWCQNPQYHLSIPSDSHLPTGKTTQEDIYLKIVIRRNDKISGGRGGGGGGGGGYQQNTNVSDSHKAEPTIGFVVCKPEIQEEVKSHTSQIGKPRLNPFGEVMFSKPSTLKKKKNKLGGFGGGAKIAPYEEGQGQGQGQAAKVIEKKRTLNPLYFSQFTTYSNKLESCMYFPKLPHAWVPDGLILVPSLSEKHARGSFEIEIYSNVKLNLKQLPETKYKSLASEWIEGLAGGSHLTTSSKKNPKFELILRASHPSRSSAGGGGGGGAGAGGSQSRCKVKITLTRTGSVWKQLCRHDAVGCMIGFYIYHVIRAEQQHGGGGGGGGGGGTEQMRQIYESSFVPTDEISTNEEFYLDYLMNPNEAYLIMPTTFMEGKHGSFVLTVNSDCDFTLNKEQGSSSHK